MRHAKHRKVVDDDDGRAGRRQRDRVVREHSHVGAQVGKQAGRTELHPRRANAGARDVNAILPASGKLGGRRPVRQEDEVIARAQRLEEAVDEMLGVVADARPLGRAGSDLDRQLQGAPPRVDTGKFCASRMTPGIP